MSSKKMMYFAKFCKYWALLLVLAGILLAANEFHEPKKVLICAFIGGIIAWCGTWLVKNFEAREKWYRNNKMPIKVK